MRCEVAREALSARLDGERATVPSARVDEHLAGCADCTTWFAAVGDLSLPAWGVPLHALDTDDEDDFVDKLMATESTPLVGGHDDAARRRWVAALVAAFVAAVLVVAVVVTGAPGWLIGVLAVAVVLAVGLTVRAGRRIDNR